MNAVARFPRIAYTSGTLEALKWAAFASMLVDHANTVFFGREVQAMYALGRLAFPIFAMVIGYNMARPHADHGRLLRRLLVFGVLSQPLAIATINRGELLPFNVLFTFAAAVWFLRWWDEGKTARALGLLLAAMVLVDYMAVGVLLVASTAMYVRRPGLGPLLAVGGSLIGLCAINGNAWALVSVAGLLVASRWDVAVPRFRWAFWIAYPAHFTILGVLARLWA